MKTRTQRFAGKAIARLQAVAEKDRKEYKPRADSFPAMVLQSGLTQSLGFLIGKGGTYLAYANDVALVMDHRNATALHQAALEADLPGYRRLTREVLEAATLLKRYGQIHLKMNAPSKESTDGG